MTTCFRRVRASFWLLASVALLVTRSVRHWQIADSAAGVVADIPVNYTEANPAPILCPIL